ncbi:MAG: DUF429 domain-containing protein [Chitinivibrionales bacterium]
MRRKKIIGIDGCPAGWFAVAIRDNASLQACLYDCIEHLWSAQSDADLILIDMPVGLADSSRPRRECDRMARLLLGKRRSSIFSPPIREVLGCDDYESANKLSRMLSGTGLSVQSWNISRKIGELDCFLRKNRRAVGTFRESHPELCFMTLNEMNLPACTKKQPRGVEERLQILSRYMPGLQSFYEHVLGTYTRRDVRRDDIIDALALAIRGFVAKPLNRLPAKGCYDQENLPKVIWY